MDAIDLIHESLRVRFEPDPGGGYHFTTAVLVDGAWRPAAAWPNTVVAGGLALAPDSIEPGEAGWRLRGIAHGAGVDPTTVSFAWEGTIARAPRGGMTFEARMTLPAPLAEPPALVLWLGPLSTMTDRQALTWRRTLLAGPTRNAQGLPGNDLPALYFFDPATAVETILAYDSQMLTWAPGRFLTLQCREVLEYGNPGRYGVGLVGARGPLPAGSTDSAGTSGSARPTRRLPPGRLPAPSSTPSRPSSTETPSGRKVRPVGKISPRGPCETSSNRRKRGSRCPDRMASTSACEPTSATPRTCTSMPPTISS
ncbi:MAG: hypothetical protein M5U01_33265 [Ardenticatenaceae bacterium]|nr:hypothetical protein [Ardenticatenaceae bacterium]